MYQHHLYLHIDSSLALNNQISLLRTHCSVLCRKQLSGTLPQQSGWNVRVGFLRRHVEGTPRTGRAAENRLSGDAEPSPSIPAQCKCHDPASYSWSHDHIQREEVSPYWVTSLASWYLTVIPTVMIVWITVLCDVTLFSFVSGYLHFRGICCIRLCDRRGHTYICLSIFYPEDGGSNYPWNVGTHLPGYMAVHPRILYS